MMQYMRKYNFHNGVAFRELNPQQIIFTLVLPHVREGPRGCFTPLGEWLPDILV